MRSILVTSILTVATMGMGAHDAAAQPGRPAPVVCTRGNLCADALSHDRRTSSMASRRRILEVLNRRRLTPRLAAAQATNDDERSGFAYARLGYGAIVGDRAHRGESVGFGYRMEGDSLGLDVSLSLQDSTRGDPAGASGSAWAGALPRLQLLYFLSPSAAASGYIGGGLSRGGMSFSRDDATPFEGTSRSSWRGHGLQGEVTAGYEFPRGSSIRIFVEANAALPFYHFTSETYTLSGAERTVEQRFGAAAVSVSLGLGWRR